VIRVSRPAGGRGLWITVTVLLMVLAAGIPSAYFLGRHRGWWHRHDNSPPPQPAQWEKALPLPVVLQLRSVDPLDQKKGVEQLCKILAEGQEEHHGHHEEDRQAREQTRDAALAALNDLRPDLAPHVNALLFGEHGDMARHLEAIGKLGENGAPAAPVVRAVLDRYIDHAGHRLRSVASFEVRECLQTLVRIEPESHDTFDALVSVMTLTGEGHGVIAARADAAAALGELVQLRPRFRRETVKVLIPALVYADQHPRDSEDLALAAIATLRECGPEAREALPELKKLKHLQSDKVRDAADRAVEKIERRD
jgi:hypothetical protein